MQEKKINLAYDHLEKELDYLCSILKPLLQKFLQSFAFNNYMPFGGKGFLLIFLTLNRRRNLS